MDIARTLRRRIRALFSKSELDRELDDEMRLHIAMETEDLIRSGIAPAEAARRARVAFGGVELHKEETRDARGVRSLEDRARDVGYILRSLRRAPAFTLAVVFSLALGIGANSTMFTIISAVLLRPLPYPHGSELIAISSVNKGRQQGALLEPYVRDWQRSSRTLSAIALYAPNAATIAGNALPERVPGSGASAELFDVLGVHPALGRFFTHDDEEIAAEPVVIISAQLWRRQFGGDSSIVGRMLSLDDKPRRVVGIVPDGLGLPQRAEYWTPWKTPVFNGKAVGFFYVNTVARPRAGVALAQVQRELSDLMHRTDLQLPPPARGAEPVAQTLHDQLFGSARRALSVLFVAVLLLLLIACANVTNLVLARTAQRQREFAVRMTLGAGRATLAWLVLAESVVLAITGSAVGLVLSIWVTRLFVGLSPATIANVGGIGLNAEVFAFTSVLAMCSALLVGVGPSLRASRRDPRGALTEGGNREGSGRVAMRIRRLLVVAQLAITVVLLVGAGLLVRSLARLNSVDLGFKPERVLVVDVSLPRARYAAGKPALAFFEQLAQRLRAVPAVTSVAFGAPPLSGFVSSMTLPPTSPHAGVDIAMSDVSDHYFETFGIPVREGRGITAADDSSSAKVVVLNASAARIFFPEGSAVGKMFGEEGDALQRGTVVGVVADFPQRDVGVAPVPELFYSDAQGDGGYPGTIAIRTSGDADALTPFVRNAIHEIDPALALGKVTTMQKIVTSSMAPVRFASLLLGVFAALALIIAALGLYGVIAYGIARRSRELGIRAALGATGGALVRLVAGEMLWVIGAGLTAGLVGAWMLARVMQTLMYGTGVHDPVTFAVVAVALIITATIATLLPARRALRANPLDAIQSE